MPELGTGAERSSNTKGHREDRAAFEEVEGEHGDVVITISGRTAAKIFSQAGSETQARESVLSELAQELEVIKTSFSQNSVDQASWRQALETVRDELNSLKRRVESQTVGIPTSQEHVGAREATQRSSGMEDPESATRFTVSANGAAASNQATGAPSSNQDKNSAGTSGWLRRNGVSLWLPIALATSAGLAGVAFWAYTT